MNLCLFKKKYPVVKGLTKIAYHQWRVSHSGDKNAVLVVNYGTFNQGWGEYQMYEYKYEYL